MARSSSLKIGDLVIFHGETCRIVWKCRGSEVIGVQCGGARGFVSYIYAKDCRAI